MRLTPRREPVPVVAGCGFATAELRFTILVDTAPSTLSPPPTARRGVFRRFLWLWIALAVLAAVAAGIIVWQIQPTEYYAIRPGSVRDTTEIIRVDGAETYDPVGEIGFTTVSVLQNITRWERRRYEGDPTVTVVPGSVINGENTPDEKREIDRQRMQDSMDVATLVALDYLGYEVELDGSGAEIVDVGEGTPAETVLEVGDVVVGVGDGIVSLSDDLVVAVRDRAPGDEIELVIDRQASGEVERVTVVLAEKPDEEGVAFLGVSMRTFDIRTSSTVDVTFDLDGVGGPSAGLAFTLGVIDVLTPGELTGGVVVATTGAILADGSVGPVGGVAQKAVAARKAGAALFIVPSTEYEEALTQAGDMPVAAADTLEEALAVLDSFGGSGLAIGELDDEDEPGS